MTDYKKLVAELREHYYLPMTADAVASLIKRAADAIAELEGEVGVLRTALLKIIVETEVGRPPEKLARSAHAVSRC